MVTSWTLPEITCIPVDQQQQRGRPAMTTPRTLARRRGSVLRLAGWRCTGRRASTASPRTQSTRRADSWLLEDEGQDEPRRELRLGSDRAGNLLLDDGDELVIHAMRMRPKYWDLPLPP